MFNESPSAIVIWRQGHGIVSSDRLEKLRFKLVSLDTRRVVYPPHHSGSSFEDEKNKPAKISINIQHKHFGYLERWEYFSRDSSSNKTW